MEEKEKIKIIIADDNKDVREIMKCFILSEHPDMFDVVAMTDDGVKTAEAVEKYKPNILILNAYTGKDILQELKVIRKKGTTKIFLLSTLACEDIADKIIDIGIDYYLVKPFDYNVFLDALILVSKMII